MQQPGTVPQLRQGVEHALALLTAQRIAQVIGLVGAVAELQVALHHIGQIPESHQLLAIEAAWCRVDQAERAERLLLGIEQRVAGIEAYVRGAQYDRVVTETAVAVAVLDHQRRVLQDRVGAERHRARGLGDLQALATLEPLALVVDQADQRRLDPEQVAGQTGERIQVGVGRCVEHVQALQGLLAFSFIRG